MNFSHKNYVVRIAAISSLAALLTLLAGCDGLLSTLSQWKASLIDKTTQVSTDAYQKFEDIKTQVNDTKDAVEGKIEDVQNAAKEVDEAVDAVKKVTE